MREKAKHSILVPRDKLTTKSLGPTSLEQFDNMHLTSCEMAIKSWKLNWLMCPVCAQTFELFIDSDGVHAQISHKPRKEILV